MITSVSVVGVWVLDQDEALEFYTKKLGFIVHTDAKMADFRWLTVTPPEQPDLQIALSVPNPPMVDAESAAQLKGLIAKGVMTGGVLLSRDCRRTCEELKAHGVEVVQEPVERFYGVDAAFRDNSGNQWRITQPAQTPSREFPRA